MSGALRELVAGGELVYDIEEQHFPFSSDSLQVRGRKATSGSWAYLLNGRLPLHAGRVSLQLGGELYRMDPDYGGGYDSRRGGTVFFTDRGGSRGDEPYTQEFPLVADNDDNDENLDDSFADQGRFQQAGKVLDKDLGCHAVGAVGQDAIDQGVADVADVFEGLGGVQSEFRATGDAVAP